MIRPIYLQPGDKVALVDPSGLSTRQERDTISRLLEEWGLRPSPGKRATRGGGGASGLEDWQNALDDEEARAIWCLNGRYGSLRIVEEADYSVFQGNPKWVIGMDDATVLHAKLYSLGIESLHAFTPDMREGTSEEAVAQVRNFLFGMPSAYSSPATPGDRFGIAEGELIGGDLGWTHSLLATRFAHHTRGTILFVEDATDDLNLIDRYARCLRYSGLFHHIEGMVVGQFGPDDNPAFQEEANRIVRAAIEDYDFPACFNFPAGHRRENYPLILGADTTLTVTSKNSQLCFP